MKILYFVMFFVLLFIAVNCYFTRAEFYCSYQSSYDSYNCQLKEKWIIGEISRSYSGNHAAIAEVKFENLKGQRRTKKVLAIVDESDNETKPFPVNFVTLDNKTADDVLLNRYFYNKHDFLLRLKKSLSSVIFYGFFSFFFLFLLLAVEKKQPRSLADMPASLNKPWRH